jgi:hypothetical protein
MIALIESELLIPKDSSGDFKVSLSVEYVKKLCNAESWERIHNFINRLGVNYTNIILRCWSANGHCIQEHLDHHTAVVQLALNGTGNHKGDHQGGLLFYITDDEVVTPKREAGMVYSHNNKVLHGVTPLKKGKRYSLFFVQE